MLWPTTTTLNGQYPDLISITTTQNGKNFSAVIKGKVECHKSKVTAAHYNVQIQAEDEEAGMVSTSTSCHLKHKGFSRGSEAGAGANISALSRPAMQMPLLIPCQLKNSFYTPARQRAALVQY